jgi:hypothetical protein
LRLTSLIQLIGSQPTTQEETSTNLPGQLDLRRKNFNRLVLWVDCGKEHHNGPALIDYFGNTNLDGVFHWFCEGARIP